MEKQFGFWGVCLLWVLAVAPVQAQEFGRVEDTESQNTSYHVFTRPGEATVQVLVLGPVKSPGVYEVALGTDLGQLLALTGGSAAGVRKTTEKRWETVRVYRQDAGQRTLVYEEPLDQMLTELGSYPLLQDGDVFMMEVVQKDRLSWRDRIQLISGLATFALVVERLVSALN